MTVDQIEKLLTGKTVAQVMEITRIATDPILMVKEGLDFTNIQVQTIPGAVRFGVFESAESAHKADKFCIGYVTYVNGAMSSLYSFTEEDFARLATQHPPQAVAGLRNQRIICAH